MARLPAVVFCAVCLSACEGGESRDFAHYERAEFDPALIEEVKVFIRDIARRWEFELNEFHNEQSKWHGEEVQNVFDMLAYLEGFEPRGIVFGIGNFGMGEDTLSLTMDYGAGLPRICVDRLYGELKSGLEGRFGLDLYPADEFHRRAEESENRADEASP